MSESYDAALELRDPLYQIAEEIENANLRSKLPSKRELFALVIFHALAYSQEFLDMVPAQQFQECVDHTDAFLRLLHSTAAKKKD